MSSICLAVQRGGTIGLITQMSLKKSEEASEKFSAGNSFHAPAELQLSSAKAMKGRIANKNE